MKLAVLYHSESGNTKQVGEIIAAGAEKLEEIEAKCMSIDDVDEDYLTEAKAVIFGSPTYHGDISWQMKKWLDTEAGSYDFSSKLGAMFATENYLGGGSDVALLTLAGHLLVSGMLVYSGGAGEGDPYTHYGIVTIKDGDAEDQEKAEIFGERVANKTKEVFA
ncbi:flavodoxin family protein [Halanaerobacter jeridensis]|uniref:NAD(P)H dehydrogenase (Quinone) n=1 Tax=Halanaerobacter jeridensis TaxID=706427 RepID=A0A938XVN0_9FIRM|nr:flavodoxin family protein [Halanaerobacter jeridensis]MBM7556080.1 NAD(P)H dehydrogenase (quinone) [Halanaerobacter jeridensis]